MTFPWMQNKPRIDRLMAIFWRIISRSFSVTVMWRVRFEEKIVVRWSSVQLNWRLISFLENNTRFESSWNFSKSRFFTPASTACFPNTTSIISKVEGGEEVPFAVFFSLLATKADDGAFRLSLFDHHHHHRYHNIETLAPRITPQVQEIINCLHCSRATTSSLRGHFVYGTMLLLYWLHAIWRASGERL